MKKNFLNYLLIGFVTILLCILGNKNVFAADSQRVSGVDRYDTAIKVSEKNWTTSDYAFIATGKDFADALCATPLAKQYNAPIILVDGNTISTAVINELQRLGVKTVFIIGGTGAVSESIENSIKDIGISINRISGIDRYETSLKIAHQMRTNSKVALAVGDTFPDAISVSVPAAIESIPILLTRKDSVPEKTNEYINLLKPAKVYIIGGSDVISDKIMNQYANSKRLSGNDRVGTNIAVLNEFSNDFNMNKIFVASALDFPDGLSGAAAAVLYQSPVLLVSKNYINTTLNYISSNGDNSSRHYEILGGTGAVNSIIEKELQLGYLLKNTIVVDPGHNYGGDYGCEYKFNGVTYSETVLNMQVSAKLRNKLVEYGFDVIMTRDENERPTDDLSTSLQKRVSIANNSDAVFFISLHHDAAGSSASGISTHYSSWRPNIDDSGVVQNDDGINYDTTPSEAAIKSADIAKKIGAALATLGYSNKGAFDHNLYVTRLTNMPSVLVECGFLSNPQEAIKCADDSEQTKVASKIAEVIYNYFK